MTAKARIRHHAATFERTFQYQTHLVRGVDATSLEHFALIPQVQPDTIERGRQRVTHNCRTQRTACIAFHTA